MCTNFRAGSLLHRVKLLIVFQGMKQGISLLISREKVLFNFVFDTVVGRLQDNKATFRLSIFVLGSLWKIHKGPQGARGVIPYVYTHSC